MGTGEPECVDADRRASHSGARRVADEAIRRYRGRMQIIYVLPDYYETYPKPCYGGWGSVYLVVAPDGRILPCHGATHITSLQFDSVRDRSMAWIWEESPAFRAFRGDEWMSGAMSQLSTEDYRLWRVPLPGFCPHGQRDEHRSRLHAVASPGGHR